MEKHISEVMPNLPQLKPQEVLENYNDIELTPDEIAEALILAKQKKQMLSQQDEQKKRELAQRKFLTQKTNYDLVKGLMLFRAEKKFKPKFILDSDNELIFEILCRYFGNDRQFVSLCMSIGVDNPSLEKGILLCGIYGTGKTWMMNLFSVNQRQCFEMIEAKELANRYKRLETEKPPQGDRIFVEYGSERKNTVDDPSVFFQTYRGLCIDDFGNEELKNSFGNKKNVIGELIELRYTEKTFGPSLHGTINLSAEQIEQYYGGRVRSRMREMFNFIELSGTDRRK